MKLRAQIVRVLMDFDSKQSVVDWRKERYASILNWSPLDSHPLAPTPENKGRISKTRIDIWNNLRFQYSKLRFKIVKFRTIGFKDLKRLFVIKIQSIRTFQNITIFHVIIFFSTIIGETFECFNKIIVIRTEF